MADTNVTALAQVFCRLKLHAAHPDYTGCEHFNAATGLRWVPRKHGTQWHLYGPGGSIGFVRESLVKSGTWNGFVEWSDVVQWVALPLDECCRQLVEAFVQLQARWTAWFSIVLATGASYLGESHE